MTILLASSVISFCGIFLLVLRLRNVGRRPTSAPPGPPTVPILGNLHQLPKRGIHYTFQKWAKQYGPIYSVMLGTNMTILINKAEVAKELLEKRSTIWSNRPELYMAMDVMGSQLRFNLMPYGPQWRMVRRISHSALGVEQAKSLVPYQDIESKCLLRGFLDAPEDFVDHIHRYANSVINQICWGFRSARHDDPRLIQVYEKVSKQSALVSSAPGPLLDCYPLLRHLPDFLNPTRKKGAELHAMEKKLYISRYNDLKAKVKAGKPMSSFCEALVKAQETEGFGDDLAAYIAGNFIEAGSETVSTTLLAFVQAMILYPEVQARAHEVLDSVCGDERMPTIEDGPRLQYIRACQKEILRWWPNLTQGVPRATSKDDVFMGYHIPANTQVFVNTWSLHMDPDRYPNPEVFDPMRYEDDYQSALEAANNPDVSKRDSFAFGAGRRICPGIHVSERTLFYAISRLLWAYRIEPADPGQLPIQHSFPDGFVAIPDPFQARLVPRSEERVRIIKQDWESCRQYLDDEGQWKVAPQKLKRSAFKFEGGA
ncbi:hypothetical protein DHEL01_v210299 [Diaporthe helianthi]|uniref:Cytochrome P450 n=1 Tax=Diaporthe helianthi TaxID=158607 RepID=A0A2P5HM25_DIAHE|nr:hypothetical protein DHEL01_v210299 [Diaporthe helianthi]